MVRINNPEIKQIIDTRKSFERDARLDPLSRIKELVERRYEDIRQYQNIIYKPVIDELKKAVDEYDAQEFRKLEMIDIESYRNNCIPHEIEEHLEMNRPNIAQSQQEIDKMLKPRKYQPTRTRKISKSHKVC